MLKIGQFARIGMVTVKTLRFYDEEGLLQPVIVDEFSGYRFYSASQLVRLNSILALKDLGFSLEQVKSVLDSGREAGLIRTLLTQKEEELTRLREDLAERLLRVRVRLKQLEEEGEMPDFEVVVKRVDALRVVSVKDVIPSFDEVSVTFNRLFDEVIDHINKNGGKFAGPAFDLWLDTDMKDHDMSVQAGIPIDGNLPETDRLKLETLPTVENMACVIMHGDFSNIQKAHGAVHEWIHANNYQISGPCREVYLQYERHGDPSQYVTEIQYPISKA